MERIIKKLQDVTALPVKPHGIDSLDECIVYTPVPQSNDGAVQVDRLELRLITHTLERAEQLKPLITSALVTVGDEGKNGYNSCVLNGGGSMKDPNGTLHTIMYFYITRKSEVKIYG